MIIEQSLGEMFLNWMHNTELYIRGTRGKDYGAVFDKECKLVQQINEFLGDAVERKVQTRLRQERERLARERPRRHEVTGCQDCLARVASECRHPSLPEGRYLAGLSSGKAPDWCELRKAPLLIKIPDIPLKREE